MLSRLHVIAGALLITLIATVSCAGGDSSNPVPTTPDLTRQVESTEAGHYLWAYYRISVDPVHNTYEITPFRQVSDHWNVLKFLEKGPCTTCVAILGIADTVNGTKLFDVQISHPFSSANLTGFDVRGIAMFAASHTFPTAGLTTSDREAGDGELVNADGYTALYNPSTAGSGPGGFQGYFKGKYTPPQAPNALLNGYKRHISPGATNLRNAFYTGSAVVQTYEIDMPDTQFIFGYAVDASWAVPTTKPVTNPNTDFPPEANCPEPWKIEVTQENVDQGLTDQGGEVKLYIDVYDHQGKNTNFAPKVECPELFGGNSTAVWSADFTDYTRYTVNVPNENIAPQGDYRCLIAVKDTASIDAPPWLDLTGYQIVTLTVAPYVTPENQPPVAAAHADPTNPLPNEIVHFYDDSTDPDGADDIIKWEWDFSFDPVDGFQPGSEEQNPTVQYPNPGIYKVQLRVTDSAFHTDMLDTPLTITVEGSGNTPPVACGDADMTKANIQTLIHFYDCSIDEDGLSDIVFFEWDLDGDGFYEKTIKDVTKIYSTGGDYNVQHRVTDTASNVDTLDVPLLIEINGPPIAQAEASAYTVAMGEIVTLTNTSIDDDGNGPIEEVYWDMNGDGDYTDPEDIQDQDEIMTSFFVGGVHEIGLMVVDQGGLEDEIDPPLSITVQGVEPFCLDLIDQWNSADHLFGQRVFNYYQGEIDQLIPDLDYKTPNGPWDFTQVPTAQPAICTWFTPTSIDDDTPVGIWPDADFFFKEDAPISGGAIYAPHRFDFLPDGINGDLVLQGQWQPGQTFDYADTFEITHPICQYWTDGGTGVGNFAGLLDVSISWTMECLGTGPAIFIVDGDQLILNCALIRHKISFVDIDYGGAVLNFSLLNYQWIDEDGNEVAFMEATKGLDGNNYSGNNYTGEVICRTLKSIS